MQKRKNDVLSIHVFHFYVFTLIQRTKREQSIDLEAHENGPTQANGIEEFLFQKSPGFTILQAFGGRFHHPDACFRSAITISGVTRAPCYRASGRSLND
jgi:hypothetical protein